MLVDVATHDGEDGGGYMELSGKLVIKLAVFENGLTPEQAQELANLEERVQIIRDRVWESWEEFVEAHE
jgi:chaperone required for assembly of F1-ATPase